MGRFKSGQITERKLEWGSITFNDKYHITVKTSFYTAIFHRYGAPQGYYSKYWKLFRQELLRRKLNSVYDVYRYANKFEVTSYIKHTGVAQRDDEKIKSEEKRWKY